MRRGSLAVVVVVAVAVGGSSLAAPTVASAVSPLDPQCLPGGGLASAGCSLTGTSGGIATTATNALTTGALDTIAMAVVDGAGYVLKETAQVLGKTTAPQLTSTWFSATYWRVAAIASVLSLPFLFAAAIQALVRSDLSLLVRAALGYLPVAFLAVAVAAPLTMLLLAATDEMSAIVSSTAGNQGVAFFERATGLLSSIAVTFGSPFVLLLVGLLSVAGAIALWLELLVRDAAVYVIVLMLPLAFAAFVWPARRIWAIRSIELLFALILSKFVIVAVLSLGGAALDHSAGWNITGLLAGAALMTLAAFTPWALLRLIPLAEVASAAASSLKPGAGAALLRLQQADARATQVDQWASKMAQMREAAGQASPADTTPEPPPAQPQSQPSAEAARPSPPAGGDTATAGATVSGSATCTSPGTAEATGTATAPKADLPPMHPGSDGNGPVLNIERRSDDA